MKRITPDINLQNDIQRNKVLESREFYKGKSFNFAHNWHAGIHYFNDSNVTDFVVYENVLLACKQTHLSSSNTLPIIIYDRENPLQPIGVDSKYWSFVLSGIVGNTISGLKVGFSPNVESLPSASQHVGEIYVVGPVSTSGNAYLEYIAIHTPSYSNEYTWELIGGGNTSLDMSEYLKKVDADKLYQTKGDYVTSTQLIDKQDKIHDLDAIREGALKGNTALQEEQYKGTVVGIIIDGHTFIPNNEGVITLNLNDYVTIDFLTQALSSKQNTLVSGNNIKTINGQSILGSGNIEIQGVSEDTDLSNYYTKGEIDEKGYLTSIPSEYVTESELNDKLATVSISKIDGGVTTFIQ